MGKASNYQMRSFVLVQSGYENSVTWLGAVVALLMVVAGICYGLVMLPHVLK